MVAGVAPAMMVAMLLSAGAGSASAAITCTISEKLLCNPGEGCAAIKNSIVVRIDFDKQVYSRCDAKGCDDYIGQFSKSGVFINIGMPDKGMLAKLSSDGSSFLEVVTLMTATFVSYGSCE